jgi:hypothetical protein
LAVQDGPPATWLVRRRADAPSVPGVLSQEDSSRTDSRFAMAVLRDSTWRDLSMSVRCAMIGGRVDRACGIVWRYKDPANYYIARANALENNVRLYYVENGSRHEIASWNGTVSSCEWHTLRADARGDQLDVFWNGQPIIQARDSRFPDAGRVGLWIKADSRTLFDDLMVSPRP